MPPIYDKIGRTYSATRSADPRITEQLIGLLGLTPGAKLLDVGAGTGNYSQALALAGFRVTALEPSQVMRDQGQQHEHLTWAAGVAEELPFEPDTFDGLVMTLCMHHFSDWRRALNEANRVVGDGPFVFLSFDPYRETGFWLFDYFPAFLEQDKQWFPKITAIATHVQQVLGRTLETVPCPLPSDLQDHFLASGWARPEIYLQSKYRAGISSFSAVDPDAVQQGLRTLEADLESGAWDERYGFCRQAPSLDVGYLYLRIH